LPFKLSHLHESKNYLKALLTLALKIAKVAPSREGDTKMTNIFFVQAYKFYYFFNESNNDLCCKED
jgi:hypothetical protein